MGLDPWFQSSVFTPSPYTLRRNRRPVHRVSIVSLFSRSRSRPPRSTRRNRLGSGRHSRVETERRGSRTHGGLHSSRTWVLVPTQPNTRSRVPVRSVPSHVRDPVTLRRGYGGTGDVIRERSVRTGIPFSSGMSSRCHWVLRPNPGPVPKETTLTLFVPNYDHHLGRRVDGPKENPSLRWTPYRLGPRRPLLPTVLDSPIVDVTPLRPT